MELPSEKNLTFPHNVDSTPYLYFSRFFGWFYQKKLSLLLNFLDTAERGHILEVGCGAGVALKELSQKSLEVLAIDIHPYLDNVGEMLQKEGISNVRLMQHDIFGVPLGIGHGFDFIFTSSVLEHISKPRLHSGIKNIHDVLNPDGYLLAGFPLKSPAINGLFLLFEKCVGRFKKGAYKFSLKDDHPSGQNEIIPILEEYFTIEERKYFFRLWPRLYVCLKCKKKRTNGS